MTDRVTKCTPVLKVGEFDPSTGGGAYISFGEELGIPDFDCSGIRFEFTADNSFENAQKIADLLRSNGFQFVVQN
jgi:hypothetical protein